MSKTTITIKPNNHRIHPCPTERKLALITEIVARNAKNTIVIVSSSSNDMLKENIIAENVTILSDKELITNKEITFDYLISYDLPDTAIFYIARVAKATEMAVALVDDAEHKKLYPIETLLGRTIKQEIISGYEPKVIEKNEDDKPAYRKMSKEKIKEVAKQRYNEGTGNVEEKSFDKPKFDKPKFDKPKFDKPKKDFKKSDRAETPDKWKKQKKAPNKFLGKDENGKAIFSGKSGDRNHRYDGTPKDRYDAPKKVGKTIKIKSRKPSED